VECSAFAPGRVFNAKEPSSNLARYATVAPLCRGKVILDIACGEGDGSHYLAKECGAARVIGLDVLPVAIRAAKSRFASENIDFIEASVDDIGDIFEEQTFDLIVCLATVKLHAQPTDFVRALKKIGKKNAVLLIYRSNERNCVRNSVIKSKSFIDNNPGDLYSTVSAAFGEPGTRYCGVAGFVNIREACGSAEPGQTSAELLFKPRPAHGEQHLLTTGSALSPENCAYVLGVWGDPGEALPAATVHVAAKPCPDGPPQRAERPSDSERELRRLRENIFDLESKIRSERLARKAAVEEIRLLHLSIRQLSGQTYQSEPIPWRVVAIYRAFRRFVPDFAISWAAVLFDKAARLRR
jgi:SAM-dependent methyltransferase